MTILTALAGLYERMAAAGDVPGPGYSIERIGGEVVIDAKGGLVAITPRWAPDDSIKTVDPMHVPTPPLNRRGRKLVSGFLWDPAPYALGIALSGDALSCTANRAREKHAAFREFHQNLLAETDDAGLAALLAFLNRWQPQSLGDVPRSRDLAGVNIAFRLDQDTGPDGQLRFLHERPAAGLIWRRHLENQGGHQDQMCLVTGTRAPVARLHPSFTGFGKGAQSSGAYLVSFNIGTKEAQGASSSYGKEQGDLAPVSQAAAFGYGTALNALLTRAEAGPRQRSIMIGDTTTVFWAETPDRAHDEAAEDVMGWLLSPPDRAASESPAERNEQLRNTAKALARGQRPDDPRIHPDIPVYVLGLAPNAARLSVRFWFPERLGEFVRRMLRFHEELQVEAPANLPFIGALLLETALQRKPEHIPPRLSGDLLRAVLGSTSYPRPLLAAVIDRIRVDGIVNSQRAGICRAFVVRNLKEECPVILDPGYPSSAYRLGRLFAILEKIQKAAIPGRALTIRDHHFATASASPARIFPRLLQTARHHLATIRTAGRSRQAHLLAELAGNIQTDLEARFPGNLRIEDQGRFVVGYYHQRFIGKTAAEEIETRVRGFA